MEKIEKIGILCLIIGIIFIISSITIVLTNYDRLKETKIEKINCFDKYNNKIIGIECEKIENLHFYEIGGYTVSGIVGLIMFLVGIKCYLFIRY